MQRIHFVFACAIGLCLQVITGFSAHAQLSTGVAEVSPSETFNNQQLTVRAELTQGAHPTQVFFLFRPFGELDFRRLEMDRVGSTASVSIGARSVSPPFIEYYIVLVDEGGRTEVYPLSDAPDPLHTPPARTGRIVVRDQSISEEQIIFLSPEPFSTLLQDDILISISLLRADSSVERSHTRIFIDDAEVTDEAIVSGDIIVYAPENSSRVLTPGSHTVTVRLYNQLRVQHCSATLFFTVRAEGQFAASENPNDFRYSGSLGMETRHETIRSTSLAYNRGTLTLNGKNEDWQLRARAFVTSEENRQQQPQDRFLLGVQSSWLTLTAGDVYPVFPNLILNGKRVRGANAVLRSGNVNFDIAVGETMRGIEGALLYPIPVDSLAAEQIRDPSASYAPLDAQTWGKFRYGTYSRSVVAIRPSFGKRESGQFGLSILKGKDDTQSIRNGFRPEENLVVGADAVQYYDGKSIELSAEAAISAYNADISSGNFTDKYIDSVYTDRADEVKRIRGLLDGIITVNENLRPLSLKRFSTLAWDASAALNYFNHLFKISYTFRGSDFNSFGQTYLRNDIRGFNIGDRTRILNNQLLLSLQFERLTDNTSQTKIATTAFTSTTIAGSYYPQGHLPGITLSLGFYGSDNGIKRSQVDSLSMIDDNTFRLFVQSMYDFEFGAQHTALASVSYAKRNDHSFRGIDVANTVFSLGISTRYAIALQTSFDVVFNFSKQPSLFGIASKLNYTSLSLSGRYSVMDNALQLYSTIAPTLGDFRRTTFDAGTQYVLLKGMILELQYTTFSNPGFTNENVWSLRLRYDL